MRLGRRIALSGMLCALAVVILSLGGFIPLSTFCCPALAGACLIPIFVEFGGKLSLCAWFAIAALGLMLSPDKEAALLFAFIGYYPILRWRLTQLRPMALRILAKLGVFNLAIGLMYALCLLVLRMDALLREYRELGLTLALVCLLTGNLTLLLYDRLLERLALLYARRFRSGR